MTNPSSSAERKREFISAYRVQRWKKAQTIEWSFTKDAAVAFLSAAIVWVVLRPDFQNAWQNSVVPFIGGACGLMVMNFILRPVFRYVRSVPEEQHLDLLHAKAELEQSVRALEEAQKPKIAIEFDAKDSCECHYPDPTFGTERMVTLYRVRIRNLSTTRTVEGMTVTLDCTEPELFALLPLHLHQMHDNDQPFQATFDLNAGDRKYIDVVSTLNLQPGNCEIEQTDLEYQTILIPLDKTTKLTVSATGKDVPKVIEYFAVYTDIQGDLKFELWSTYERRVLVPQNALMEEVEQYLTSVAAAPSRDQVRESSDDAVGGSNGGGLNSSRKSSDGARRYLVEATDPIEMT